MSRISFKVTGAQGQGVNSVGEVCAKGLKRSGYCVFGYREYMSLIKGGHSSYQLDISPEKIMSSEKFVNILICFNHKGLTENLRDLKDGGILLHQTPEWSFAPEDQKWIEEHKITVLYLPSEKILKKHNAKPIFSNVLITSVVWLLLGQDIEKLKELIKTQFEHKGKEAVEMNFNFIDEGVAFKNGNAKDLTVELPEGDKKWSEQMLLTGNEAMGMGTIHAGCRVFVGYPMTPTTNLMKYISDKQNESGMVIKQAEDEITAAQMVVGAMHMGTRAATATSGGGYDLMTETISLSGITETPAVFILGQRPGPGTCLPTWTAQGDLLMAAHCAHGELTHLVMSVSDAQDGFDLMPEAFNLAEEYQIPVTVLTDKQIGECLFTQEKYDQEKAEVRRGNLVTDKEGLSKLKAEDRYDPADPDGISPRWLPGSDGPVFCAQGDEHDEKGASSEEPENSKAQMEKRLRKIEVLRQKLPEPEIFGDHDPETLIVSWGSNKGVIQDVLNSDELKDKAIGYLHYTYMYPINTKRLEKYAEKAKKILLVEGNQQGQLGMLIKMQCGIDIKDKILKFNGRSFYFDELKELISSHLA